MAEQAGILLPLRRRGQRLAIDDAKDTVNAIGNTAGEIAAAEFRRDDLVDNALGADVGERALETIADLDPQLAIVLGDDENGAVVDLLAADLPGLRDPERILLDGFRLGRRHDQHRDLAAFSGLEIPQGLVE